MVIISTLVDEDTSITIKKVGPYKLSRNNNYFSFLNLWMSWDISWTFVDCKICFGRMFNAKMKIMKLDLHKMIIYRRFFFHSAFIIFPSRLVFICHSHLQHLFYIHILKYVDNNSGLRISDPTNRQHFKGSENPITMSRFYNIRLVDSM